MIIRHKHELENIVSDWMPKGIKQPRFMDLVENLIRENIIPSTLKKNQTLHSILITHIILYMLYDLNIPDTDSLSSKR